MHDLNAFSRKTIGVKHYYRLLTTTVFMARSYTKMAVKIIFTAGFLPHCTQPDFEPRTIGSVESGGEINTIVENSFCSES